MSEEKQLPSVVITEEMAPELYVPMGLDGYLAEIREAVNEVPDLSTKKGRDRIASLAASVSRSKTAIEKPGREYLKRLKEAVKPAEGELKRFVDECDTLRDEVRRPLTEYENAEKERVASLQTRLTCLRDSSRVVDDFGTPYFAAQISDRLAEVKAIAIDESWQELTAEAGVAKDATVTKLESALELAIKREAEAAELEQLRIQQEQQRQKDQEALREKEIADRVKREAELAAQAEREASAKREAGALAAQQKAERDKQEAAERAEREKQEAIASEQRKAKEKEEARQAEERRIAEEAAARAANVAHRKTIGIAVVNGLMQHAGLTREQAISTLTALMNGQIPHTSISY